MTTQPQQHSHNTIAADTANNMTNTNTLEHSDSNIRSHNHWKLPWLALIPALIMFIGLTSICYPPAMQYFNKYVSSKVVHGYNQAVDLAQPDKNKQLSNARIYNQALETGAIYEPNSNIPRAYKSDQFKHNLPTPLDYDHQLTAGSDGLMARLKIPKLKLDLPIYHGTSDETLLKGLGHLRGTSLPVGGAGTRAVIAGHRGLAEAEMFTNLDKIHKGDVFSIDVFGETLVYQVIETVVVDPDQTKYIEAERGKDLVTLVTCTPLGINTQRILVTGERIYPVPQNVERTVEQPITVGFPWWALLYGGGIVFIGWYIWWSGLPVKKRSQRSQDITGQHISEA